MREAWIPTNLWEFVIRFKLGDEALSLGDVTEWMKYFIESRVSLHLIQEPHELLRCQVTAITSEHMHTYEQPFNATQQQ